MQTAKQGDRVRVQYVGLSADGSKRTQPRRREVLEFTVGSNEVISGIDQGVIGMSEGQEKRLSLTPQQAYGEVRPKLIKEVARHRIPAHVELYVGKRLTVTGSESRRRRQVQVVEIRPNSVVLDANHRMAGKAVEVELQLISLDTAGSDG
jgi:peptidylprolyl isomerase